MTLPGLTKAQMVAVDRIMMEDLEVPVELMMEHAGSNLARLAVRSSKPGDLFTVIVGSGNNGAGGLVAARRLAGWGHEVQVYAPRGVESFRRVSAGQFARLRSLGVSVSSGVPKQEVQGEVLLDAYLGYGFVSREDKITDQVLDHFSNHPCTVCLDVPTGFNPDTGEGVKSFNPRTTLTIAFVKEGLLRAYPALTGDIYVCDIGVPLRIYEKEIGLNWESPFEKESLFTLGSVFERNSMAHVKHSKSDGKHGWLAEKVTD